MGVADYGYEKRLGGAGFEETIARVSEALKQEGFGVLTEIDVKNTLKKKLDVDFRNYKILGACNPVLANQALKAEPHIGLLLPCNVVVQQSDEGEIIVSVANAAKMFTMVDNPSLAAVAEDADSRLRRVLDAL